MILRRVRSLLDKVLECLPQKVQKGISYVFEKIGNGLNWLAKKTHPQRKVVTKKFHGRVRKVTGAIQNKYSPIYAKYNV
jgi:hypothetical protein